MCSMFENMIICVKIWLLLDICVKYAEVCSLWSLVWKYAEGCAVSVSDGHYTKSGNSSVSDEEKGRRVHKMCILYLRRRETRPCNGRFISQEHASPFYLTCTKKIVNKIFSMRCFLRQPAMVPTQRARHNKHRVEHKLSNIFEVLRLSWVKSWWALLLVGEVIPNF
jgi:hypothetical protein